MNAASNPPAANLAASGYSLVLPPGWAKVPLREGTDGAIAAILDRTFAGHSRDAIATPRRDLQVRLRDLAHAARRNRGVDLYLPTEQVHGFTIGASFVVAEAGFGSVETLDPVLLVARLAADAQSAPVIVDGVTGSRTEGTSAPDPERNAPFGSRRVDYVAPVPGDPDRWLLVSFSTIGQGDPHDEFAHLFVELFDAIMTTFRWSGSGERIEPRDRDR